MRGQLLLVDLGGKLGVRRAVVVSSDEHNNNKCCTDIIVIPLTKIMKSYRVKVPKMKGLRYDSYAKISAVTSVEKQNIIRVFGKVPDEVFSKIEKELTKLLGF